MNGYSIVSTKESKEIPYPYVYLTGDGCYKELTKGQRALLEKEFHPGDGAIPYILIKYSAKESGFIRRSLLPAKYGKKK